uniref:Uncharacterized protein n=1 Tax=viral metagenome TaxID=1070528 RepID=A0A6H1ZJS8_9ZZZZ
MKKFTIQKEEGIIDGSWRTGWTVYEKIGEIWGKRADEELSPLGFYRTRKEAKNSIEKMKEGGEL